MKTYRIPRPWFTVPAVVVLAGMLFIHTANRSLAGEKKAHPDEVREPVLAGSWYPASPEELRAQVEGFISRASSTEIPGHLVALISPHAGYTYSGQVAAHSYKLLMKERFETVVILAPSHHTRFSGVAVYDRGGFRTPLGLVPLDDKFISSLEAREPRIHFVPEAHAKEHSLEIQLPFLQTVMPGFKLVPLVMGEQDFATCEWLSQVLAESIKDKQVLIVASSDLSHYHTYDEATRLDQVVQDKLKAFDAKGLSGSLAQGACEACGGGPMVTAMLTARRLGANTSQIIKYANSGDVTGNRADPRGVVGYVAAAFWADASKRSEVKSEQKKVGVDLGLSNDEKAILHRIAAEAITAKCKGTQAPKIEAATKNLKELRGAFVTLQKNGELRGCIGRLLPTSPLAETISEMAIAAAFHDPRFRPVSSDELKDLKIEISVLTPFRRIQSVEEIQIGVHGLLMKQGSRSGLLLPQVATEYGWNRETFLENTCIKAGLPGDAWKDKATEIHIFSADVF